ncbi:AAA family ATPase [Streptomyces olivaceus]|uniref:HelD family protein n=1 Tax=Streptomyces TaxID=1883 RepID=UPI001CCC5674|nr:MULTISPECIES: AAA family ATPase [Streptomyces]MBZ6130628.1 AAA family ATPase [Streptomyces olivaceus]MBZ6141047.1 AAA family ATPase [Streptomyces olivaceus]MBZ6168587.1 AAA family ATPase [Streptomyces olivaceus]MBZ6175855.1 AAA family ATPase [Streptomyces olivaceus]MBZ6182296.1 AAA family ATPase [Streptomyces olivaceus]
MRAGVELSNTELPDDELRHEQEFVDGLYARVDALRGDAEVAVTDALAQGSTPQQAKLERDILVAERSGLLAALNAVDGSLCFGRIDLASGGGHHIGRIGLRADDPERTPVLIDWRADVARPFYLATGHTPMGLRRRRHITSDGRRVTALHDEILDLGDETRTGHEDPSGDAVLLAALNSARTGRMGDIVQTIQADQDRIIRAPHRGVLVVEGGPGTGKTAVALHRAAYLLYEHRELLAKRAVLIVGPNPAFLGYIGEVLPSLGETGVLLSTVGELFPGVRATAADLPAAAAVKGRADMADVLAEVVRDRQTLPDPVIAIEHDRDVLMLDDDLVNVARERTRAAKLPHNAAREHFEGHILNTLTDMVAERIGTDPYDGGNLLDPSDITQIRDELAENPEVWAAIDQLWPRLTPQRLVAGFLAAPEAFLPARDAAAVRRPVTRRWTVADVPLLDEAAELLGVDDRVARSRAEREREEQIAYAQGVLDVSYASRTYEFEDKDEEESEVLLAHDIIDAERFAERQEEDDHRSAAERAAADRTWAFGHIIVDEAQELSPMAWRLLMRRCPTRSMTLVGDPAQTAEAAGVGSWSKILAPYVEDRWEHTRLGVNYRTPAEIMDLAASVVRADDPDFAPPSSVRSTGVRPWIRATGDLPAAVAGAARELTPDEGRLAVIAPRELHRALAARLDGVSADAEPDLTHRVVLLDPRQSKGLEFDSVLVVEPGRYGTSDLYVALTRATQHLGILHTEPLPKGLRQD